MSVFLQVACFSKPLSCDLNPLFLFENFMTHRLMNVTEWKPYYFRILTLLNILLWVCLFISFLFLLRNVIAATVRKTPEPAYSARVSPRMIEKKDIQSYEAVLRNNPFGISAGSLNMPSASTSVAKSDVRLIGTIYGRTIHGYAIIADQAGKQAMFRTGEVVIESGVLKKVEKYRVLIEKNGKLTEISMVEAMMTDDVLGKPGSSLSARSIGRGEYLLDHKAVQSALDKPHQIMADAKLIPNVAGGKQEGFLLQEVKKNGIYDSLGMQNGDVLLKINDYGISNPENALQAFTALRGMDRVQLDLIRSGNKMTMTYQIR
jgi:type II secretion system protein C